MQQPRNIIFILRTLGPQAFMRLVLSRMFSVNHYYIVGKSIIGKLDHPSSFERTLSPVTEQDIAGILEKIGLLDPDDQREVLARAIFYNKGFTNCFAFKEGNDIAYIQWLVFPEENDLISKHYFRTYYELPPKQVMVENAFTFPRYRGRGYFIEGTKQLLELARQKGYNSAISYIRQDRIVPLTQFCQHGFKIVRRVREYKLLGRAWKTL